jgi:Flp pilus assembly protein TadG
MKSLIFFRRQGGTAMVELAIVIPLLLFLLLGVAEFGNAFNQYNTLTKTVRDGARYAAGKVLESGSFGTIPTTLDNSFVTAVKNMVAYGLPTNTGQPILPGLSADNVTVTRVDASHLQVSATYTYTPLLGEGASLPTFGVGGGGSIPLAFTFQAGIVMSAL